MDSGSGILVRSKLYDDQPGLIRVLLLPLVKLKWAFDAAFGWIVDRITGELMGREKLDHVQSQLAGAAVLLFCVVVYLAREHMDAVTLALLVAWRAEEWLTGLEFSSGENHKEVVLRERKDGLFEWKLDGAEPVALAADQVKELRLSRVHLQGGAILSRVATAWRIGLLSDAAPELPLYEGGSAAEALGAAKALAGRLKVPLKVAGSRGSGPLAERAPRWEAPAEEAVETVEEGGGVSLRAGWTWRSFWGYAREVGSQSGLLLFFVCLSRVLVGLGGIIMVMFTMFSASADPTSEGMAAISLDVADLPGFLNPFSSWLDVGTGAVAVGLLLMTGWRLGRPKRLALGERTRFYLGDDFAGSLVTQRLEPPLYIAQPEPLILLTDGAGVIEVADLPSPEAYASLMQRLNKEIK